MDLKRGDYVKVYRNLKHGRTARPLYSVQRNGKVVARVHRLLLQDAQFVVSEAGRQRVLREKRKNVHAFVYGFVAESTMGQDKNDRDLPAHVTYNPYTGPSFTWEGRPVKHARAVLLNEHGISAAYVD